MLLLPTAGREIVGLQQNHHAHAGTAQEHRAGQGLAFLVGDVGGELDETKVLGAEAVDGLNGYGAQGVRRSVEFMSGQGSL